MRTYKIDTFIPQGIRSGGRYTTRFGGQPDWIDAPPPNGRLWIPQTTESEEMVTTEFKQLDVDKFCGIPAFFQNSKVKSDDMLLLQLHTNWLPFYINGAGEPTMFIFLNVKKDGGFILIEDM